MPIGSTRNPERRSKSGWSRKCGNRPFSPLHPTGEFLYAVSETDDFDEDGSGSVVSFRVSANSGTLTS